MVRCASSTFRALARCAVLLAIVGAPTAQAQAQQAGASNPISAALGAIGLLRPDTGPMPGFVTRTRPPEADLHYVPLGGARPEPATKPLTPDEIKSQEAELSTLRARDDLRGGRRAPVVNARSAAGQPKAAKKTPPRTCRITCAINTKIGHNDSMR